MFVLIILSTLSLICASAVRVDKQSSYPHLVLLKELENSKKLSTNIGDVSAPFSQHRLPKNFFEVSDGRDNYGGSPSDRQHFDSTSRTRHINLKRPTEQFRSDFHTLPYVQPSADSRRNDKHQKDVSRISVSPYQTARMINHGSDWIPLQKRKSQNSKSTRLSDHEIENKNNKKRIKNVPKKRTEKVLNPSKKNTLRNSKISGTYEKQKPIEKYERSMHAYKQKLKNNEIGKQLQANLTSENLKIHPSAASTPILHVKKSTRTGKGPYKDQVLQKNYRDDKTHEPHFINENLSSYKEIVSVPHYSVNENQPAPTSEHEIPKNIPVKPSYPGEGQWAIRGLKHKPYSGEKQKYSQLDNTNEYPEGQEIFDATKEIFEEQKKQFPKKFLNSKSQNVHHKKVKKPINNVNLKYMVIPNPPKIPEELEDEKNKNRSNQIRASEDDEEEESDEEDENEGFVPTKTLAQVRKYEHEKHLPPVEPRLKEVIKDSKIHTVYTEEGYEDLGYDHAGHEKNAEKEERSDEVDEAIDTKRLPEQPIKYQSKGLETSAKLDSDNEESRTQKVTNIPFLKRTYLKQPESTEISPKLLNHRNISLPNSEIADKQVPQLTTAGNVVMTIPFVSEFKISNSLRSSRQRRSVDHGHERDSITSESMSSAAIIMKPLYKQLRRVIRRFTKPNLVVQRFRRFAGTNYEGLDYSSNANGKPTNYDSEKFPYYDDTNIHTNSPLRYAENLRNVPRKVPGKMSFYQQTQKKPCSEIKAVNPIPKRIKDQLKGKENKDKDPQQPNGPRLKNLGDKIDCFKEQLFGENPLDSPIFKEEFVGKPTSLLEDFGLLNTINTLQSNTHKTNKIKRNDLSALEGIEFVPGNGASSKPYSTQSQKIEEKYDTSKTSKRLPKQLLVNSDNNKEATNQLPHQEALRAAQRRRRKQPKIPRKPQNVLEFPSTSTVLPKYKTISEVHYKEDIKPNEQLNVFTDVIKNIKSSSKDPDFRNKHDSTPEKLKITTFKVPKKNKQNINFHIEKTKIDDNFPNFHNLNNLGEEQTLVQHRDDPNSQTHFPTRNLFGVSNVNFVNGNSFVRNGHTNAEKPIYTNKLDPLDLIEESSILQTSTIVPASNTLRAPVAATRPYTENFYVYGLRPPAPVKKIPNRNRIRRRNNNHHHHHYHHVISKRSAFRPAYAEIRRQSGINNEAQMETTTEDDDYVPRRNRNYYYDEKMGKIVYYTTESTDTKDYEIQTEEPKTVTTVTTKKPVASIANNKKHSQTNAEKSGPSFLEFVSKLKSDSSYVVIPDPIKSEPISASESSIQEITTSKPPISTTEPEFLKILSRVKTDPSYKEISDKKKTTTTPEPSEIEKHEEEDSDDQIQANVKNSPGRPSENSQSQMNSTNNFTDLQIFDISEYIPRPRNYSIMSYIDTTKYSTILRRNNKKNIEKDETKEDTQSLPRMKAPRENRKDLDSEKIRDKIEEESTQTSEKNTGNKEEGSVTAPSSPKRKSKSDIIERTETPLRQILSNENSKYSKLERNNERKNNEEKLNTSLDEEKRTGSDLAKNPSAVRKNIAKSDQRYNEKERNENVRRDREEITETKHNLEKKGQSDINGNTEQLFSPKNYPSKEVRRYDTKTNTRIEKTLKDTYENDATDNIQSSLRFRNNPSIINRRYESEDGTGRETKAFKNSTKPTAHLEDDSPKDIRQPVDVEINGKTGRITKEMVRQQLDSKKNANAQLPTRSQDIPTTESHLYGEQINNRRERDMASALNQESNSAKSSENYLNENIHFSTHPAKDVPSKNLEHNTMAGNTKERTMTDISHLESDIRKGVDDDLSRKKRLQTRLQSSPPRRDQRFETNKRSGSVMIETTNMLLDLQKKAENELNESIQPPSVRTRSNARRGQRAKNVGRERDMEPGNKITSDIQSRKDTNMMGNIQHNPSRKQPIDENNSNPVRNNIKEDMEDNVKMSSELIETTITESTTTEAVTIRSRGRIRHRNSAQARAASTVGSRRSRSRFATATTTRPYTTTFTSWRRRRRPPPKKIDETTETPTTTPTTTVTTTTVPTTIATTVSSTLQDPENTPVYLETIENGNTQYMNHVSARKVPDVEVFKDYDRTQKHGGNYKSINDYVRSNEDRNQKQESKQSFVQTEELTKNPTLLIKEEDVNFANEETSQPQGQVSGTEPQIEDRFANYNYREVENRTPPAPTIPTEEEVPSAYEGSLISSDKEIPYVSTREVPVLQTVPEMPVTPPVHQIQDYHSTREVSLVPRYQEQPILQPIDEPQYVSPKRQITPQQNERNVPSAQVMREEPVIRPVSREVPFVPFVQETPVTPSTQMFTSQEREVSVAPSTGKIPITQSAREVAIPQSVQEIPSAKETIRKPQINYENDYLDDNQQENDKNIHRKTEYPGAVHKISPIPLKTTNEEPNFYPNGRENIRNERNRPRMQNVDLPLSDDEPNTDYVLNSNGMRFTAKGSMPATNENIVSVPAVTTQRPRRRIRLRQNSASGNTLPTSNEEYASEEVVRKAESDVAIDDAAAYRSFGARKIDENTKEDTTEKPKSKPVEVVKEYDVNRKHGGNYRREDETRISDHQDRPSYTTETSKILNSNSHAPSPATYESESKQSANVNLKELPPGEVLSGFTEIEDEVEESMGRPRGYRTKESENPSSSREVILHQNPYKQTKKQEKLAEPSIALNPNRINEGLGSSLKVRNRKDEEVIVSSTEKFFFIKDPSKRNYFYAPL